MSDMKKVDYENSIVITGTSKGIGKNIAESLLESGNSVIGISRSNDSAMNGLMHIAFDLNQITKLDLLWRSILDLSEKIDVVILNAGVGHISKLVDENVTSCMEILNINFLSPYFLAKQAAKHWRKMNQIGHIIFIGSQAGFPFGGQACNSMYSASKAAIHSLVSSLSRELGPLIRVNAVAPGDVMTDLAHKSAIDFVKISDEFNTVEEYMKRVLNRSILERLVLPSEVVSSVQYLIDNKAVTGTILNVSAGSTVY